MKTKRNIILLCLLSLRFGYSYAQHNKSKAYEMSVTAGISLNPFLLVAYNRVEIGPSVSFDYRINRWMETGMLMFSRQMLFASQNEYKQISNINVPYNLETVIAPYIGVGFGQRQFRHGIQIYTGVRNDLYKETLTNPAYDINQTYRNSEWNFIMSLGYTLKYKVSEKCAISFRAFVPFNRSPTDDINRYSIEPGINFKF